MYLLTPASLLSPYGLSRKDLSLSLEETKESHNHRVGVQYYSRQ